MSRRILIGGTVAVVIAFAGFFSWALFGRDLDGSASTGKESGIAGLPSDATDVRWHSTSSLGPYYMYEFSTSREEFEAWVRRQEIAGLEGPSLRPSQIMVYDPRAKIADVREFVNAVKYSWIEGDEGIYLLYDLDGQRAYYFSHTR